MHVMKPGQRNCHLYGGEADGANLFAAGSAIPAACMHSWQTVMFPSWPKRLNMKSGGDVEPERG